MHFQKDAVAGTKATFPGQLTNSTESYAKIVVAQARYQETSDSDLKASVPSSKKTPNQQPAGPQPAAGSPISPKAAIQACKKLVN